MLDRSERPPEDDGQPDDGLTEPRVSTFELFFDLVFVFAFTRITQSVADDPTWSGLAAGVATFALLWWAWGAFAWLTNSVRTDDLMPRLALLGAMAAMLVVALAVPTDFGASGVAFALAYFAVMALHATLFVVASDDPTDSARGILRLAPATLGGAGILIVAGMTDGAVQAALWGLALFVTFVGPFITGVSDFTIRPAHFVERHGLIVIIALGESIVALGAGHAESVTWSIAGTAFAAIALITGLWWAYFNGEAEEAERALREANPSERSRLARDVYSYLHMPLVLGVVLAAVGIKKTLAASDDELKSVAAFALGGGVALFFAALAAVRVRRRTGPGTARIAGTVLAVAAIPLATVIPAIATLGGLAVVSLAVALIDHEADDEPSLEAGAEAGV